MDHFGRLGFKSLISLQKAFSESGQRFKLFPQIRLYRVGNVSAQKVVPSQSPREKDHLRYRLQQGKFQVTRIERGLFLKKKKKPLTIPFQKLGERGLPYQKLAHHQLVEFSVFKKNEVLSLSREICVTLRLS